MANDLFSVWGQLVANRKQLEQGSITKGLSQQIVELYKERVLIYAELDYYRATNKILGQHVIFQKRHWRNEVKALPLKELVKKYNATQKAIRLLKQQLGGNDRPDLKEAREANLEQKSWQLTIIEEIMQELDG